MRSLASQSIQLLPLTASHAREMFELLRDPALYEFENEPPASEQALAERYAKWEARRSPDGRQQWLNWVVRLPSGELAGYVQATVLEDGSALVAYELNSRFWRQGIGLAAVQAVIEELRSAYGVTLCGAVLKARNFRSLGLLKKLEFQSASPVQRQRFGTEDDELAMVLPPLRYPAGPGSKP